MNKFIIVILLFFFSLNTYSTTENSDTIIYIKVKKEQLYKVKQFFKINNITIISKINPIKFQMPKKERKKWITELKIAIGIGATYGLIYNEFDLGPTVSVGYEFTF